MAKKKALESVGLDPDLPLLPGRTVSFTARPASGRASVKIETARDTWLGAPSNTVSGARVSKIIETGLGEIVVTFFEDGQAYAQGTFSV